jgi:glycosyltransferase involved in cell wall biosynthesis
MVSVILPTYNRPALLDRSLGCIDRQIFEDYEVIVVNDAGQDVEEVVKRHKNTRYVLHEQNLGLSGARNTGIERAEGKYIAYQDDDDLWFPEHLEVLIEHLESLPHIKAAYTSCYRWYDEHWLLPGNEPKLPEIGKQARHIMAIINLMHEKTNLDKIGKFDESMREMEDWDFIFRLDKAFDVLHIPIYTTVYSKRGDPTQLSTNQAKMQAALDKLKVRYGYHMVGFYGDNKHDGRILHPGRAESQAVA